MQVEKYGLKWSDKGRGYYQSTTLIDGRRRWLHQYTWCMERGAVPVGYHIHHVDGNRHNNDISNLVCLSALRHAAEHAEERRVFGRSDRQIKHLESIRLLASAAKLGKYQSEAKVRERAGVRTGNCMCCGKQFELAKRSKDVVFYCSDKCRGKARNVLGEAALNIEQNCIGCGATFKPGYSLGHQLYCSEKCRDRAKYHEQGKKRACKSCGEVMVIAPGNASAYCERCVATGKHCHARECACCGREVVSRIKNGRVFCDRVCANKFRRLESDPERLARYQQAIREGRLDPGDRLPADL